MPDVIWMRLVTTAPPDPAVYLAQPQPSPAAAVLVQQMGLHAGAQVPLWHLAEVAVRVHEHSRWIGSMEGMWRKIRRHGLGAAGVLAVNVLTAIGMLLHYSWAGGAAEERAAGMERAAIERRDALEREIQDLRLDLRELRAALRRMSGIDAPASDSSEPMITVEPGKFAGVLQLDPEQVLASAAALLFAPGPPPPQSTCGASCSSNIECNFGLIKTCPFCNFGTCKSTRPESPLPDAGIDAPSAPGATPSP